MCDTFAYRGTEHKPHLFWFGKNSDREPNEAHEVVFCKGRPREQNSQLECTYIRVPQTDKTFDVLLCKPAWMWGAEMGVNSNGVIIGNEALFTRGALPKSAALTGMDLLRLGLERSTSAHAGVDCIVHLLEIHGQGGNCGYSHPFYYNNSFLIADRYETWVLETVGKDWAAKKFKTSTSISNGLTLHSDWDEASKGFAKVRDLAAERSDPVVTYFSQASNRRDCVLTDMNRISDSESNQNAFRILRSHGKQNEIPAGSLTANTVCMHAGFGPIRINQTTGSFLVDYSTDNPVIWITGTSAPCLSIFHPVVMEEFNSDQIISSQADWLINEEFHRRMLFCPNEIIREFSSERDQLEQEFLQRMSGESVISLNDRVVLTRECSKDRIDFLQRWKSKIETNHPIKRPYFYRQAWKRFNKEAKITISV